MLDYPTVYILNDKDPKSHKFKVYVGETNDIDRRTKEHLKNEDREDFEELNKSKTTKMLVIGHEHFNKSLTMDIENQMMLYLTGSPAVAQINNRRENPQSKYFTSDEMPKIFDEIWNELENKNSYLFPAKSKIEKTAIFKSSPFHKLNDEQNKYKNMIMNKIAENLVDLSSREHKLILVDGDAGAGKTVLLSSIFYLISQLYKQYPRREFKNISEFMLVNNDEQVKVYDEIALKLKMEKKKKEIVQKPTTFINHHDPKGGLVDISLIDEGHLLWTQGKQAYKGNNQLQDIIDRSRITILVFDKNQMIRTQSYTNSNELNSMISKVESEHNYIHLSTQMRMKASPKTMAWIDAFIYKQKIDEIPNDPNYDLRIFDNPKKMYEKIVEKNNDKNYGLSRMVATFDWPYNQKNSPTNSRYWDVHFSYNGGYFSMPWNRQVTKNNNEQSWAETPNSLQEVGSTFTIQGFDLNYVGVIIGPSVKYRNGKVIFDSSQSCDRNATQKRTEKYKDGSAKKVNVSESMLKNALNVLMTRGVHGLYIYAVDDELRKVLQTRHYK
ncbi:hypothetical protein LfDm3_0324 [Fructilactobacillus fructivorans]|uniref:GIY-YIG domain-containing protein n=2 Tax=Fructilactobacillus fructivorans TaxID=1614 RepID=A0A0C1LZU5_9LACO|nr:hypothetical protein LfDm3_0324 [Fructilactobacillus fructivorans]